MNRRSFAAMAVCPSLALRVLKGAGDLGADSIARMLDRRYSGPALNYVVVETGTRKVVALRWPGAQEAIPVGSLVKPFTALAWGETHGFRFPEETCAGTRDLCWRPQGHGSIGLKTAIADSCNGYFLALSRDIRPDSMERVALRYGLDPPPPDPESYIGSRGLWRTSPLRMATAYAELAARRLEPGVAEVLAGMAESARSGTGSAIGVGGLAKTGTSLCTHQPRSTGDGFTVALRAATDARHLVLVRVHGAPGVEAAHTAARILADLA